MKKIVWTALGFAATAGLVVSCTSEGKKSDKASGAQTAAMTVAGEKPLTVSETAEVSVTARVTRVDYVTRQVTLQDASGRFTTIVAGPEVKRLNEVKVGDDVTADYTVSLVAELRPPTADEAANPIAAVMIAGRSPTGQAPGAGAIEGMRVVTTVQAVDLNTMKVTLRGPMGDTTTVLGRKPENVRKLRVGDTIVITYVEAMAISLTKGAR